jgi:multiple sugar transport system permease protein
MPPRRYRRLWQVRKETVRRKPTVGPPGRRPTGTRMLRRLATREAFTGYLFISPWLIGMVVFYIGPMLASLYYSFTNYPIIGSATWTGLSNYRNLVTDTQFTTALRISFFYTAGAIILYLGGALALALLCNSKLPGIGIVRTIIFLPTLVPVFAMALIWGVIFNQSFGLANSIFHSLGIPTQGWFQSPTEALPLAITISFWTVGNAFVVFLAGLQSIPQDLYEAIVVDGAGAWSRFWHVTLPMLSPIILFNLVIGIINSFQAFDLDWALTSGGPGNATLFYVYLVWRDAFQNFQMGYASALAWVLFVVIVVVTVLIFRTARFWVHYEGQVR